MDVHVKEEVIAPNDCEGVDIAEQLVDEAGIHDKQLWMVKNEYQKLEQPSRQIDGSEFVSSIRIRKNLHPNLEQVRPFACDGSFNEQIPQRNAKESKYNQIIDWTVLIRSVKERPVLWNKFLHVYTNKIAKTSAWREVCLILKDDFEEMALEDQEELEEALKKAWNNLVEHFGKEVKKIPQPHHGCSSNQVISNYDGKWEYFHQMAFMIRMVIPREMLGNVILEFSDGATYVNIERDFEKSSYNDFRPLKYNHGNLSPSKNSLSIVHSVESAISTFSSTSDSIHCSSLSGPPSKKVKIFGSEQTLRTKQAEIDDSGKIADESLEDVEDNDDFYFLMSLLPYIGKFTGIKKLRVRSEILSVLRRNIESQGDSE